jgi:hypothetical protein
MNRFTPLKAWLLSMSEKLHISFKAAEMRYYRGRLSRPRIIRVNARVLNVINP